MNESLVPPGLFANGDLRKHRANRTHPRRKTSRGRHPARCGNLGSRAHATIPAAKFHRPQLPTEIDQVASAQSPAPYALLSLAVMIILMVTGIVPNVIEHRPPPGRVALPICDAVALAASAAFMTPISSPVNTLVLAPGCYRFGDFVKLGVPFTVIVLFICILLVPVIFPLYP